MGVICIKTRLFFSPIGNEPTKECTVKCIKGNEGCLTIKDNLHGGAGHSNLKTSGNVLIIVITISLVILLSGGLVFVGS